MLQIVIKITVTLLILAIEFGGIYALVKVWRSELDITAMVTKPFGFIAYKKDFKPPSPSISLRLMPSPYEVGLKVHDVTWESDFLLYRFHLQNAHKAAVMQDVRVHFEFPAGVVNYEVKDQSGVHDVTITQDKHPVGIASRGGKVKEIVKSYSNLLSLNASSAAEDSRLVVQFVLKATSEEEGGHIRFAYSFQNIDGKTEKEKHIYPIEAKSKNGPLSIDTENEIHGTYTQRMSIIPAKPMTFKTDGSIERPQRPSNDAGEPE